MEALRSKGFKCPATGKHCPNLTVIIHEEVELFICEATEKEVDKVVCPVG